MNEFIISTRNKVNGSFQGSNAVDYPPKTKYFSPDKKYFFEMEVFSKPMDDGITFGNHFFAKIAIFEAHNQVRIFDALNNHSNDAHHWLEIDGKTYLFFAEFAQGMTVYNLTDKTQNSDLKADSQHQIIQYFPSPDGLKLATVEYGLQELVVFIYDISKPMDLPFPIVYKKNLGNSNAKSIKTIDWLGGSGIELVLHESVQVCNTSIKVQVVGVAEDKWRGVCRFEDIDGKEHFAKEKLEAMLRFLPDENTVFPLESGISVNIEKIYTRNGQKIATVFIDMGYEFDEAQKFDVFEHQLSTYWYHKDYIQ